MKGDVDGDAAESAKGTPPLRSESASLAITSSRAVACKPADPLLPEAGVRELMLQSLREGPLLEVIASEALSLRKGGVPFADSAASPSTSPFTPA